MILMKQDRLNLDLQIALGQHLFEYYTLSGDIRMCDY